MSTYLLLRSNKQSGPYSLDEMRQMGLKAYDLVWIEGKSAAWRYPGEVEELKAYAPPVEEQPFDRFFKRPTQINQPLFPAASEQLSFKEEKISDSSKTKSEKPVAENQLDPEHKSVFASLPRNQNALKEKEPEKKIFPEKPIVQEKFSLPVREHREYMPKNVQDDLSASKREVLWEEDSFRSNRRTAGAPDNAPRIERQGRSNAAPSFMKPFLIGFSFAACLAVGIFIGLSVNNRGANSPKDISIKEDLSDPSQQALYHPKTNPHTTTENQDLDKKQGLEGLNSGNGVDEAANEEALALARKKARAKQRLADSLKLVKPAPVIDSSAIAAATMIAHPAESPAIKKDLIKNNIGEYVTLSGNSYSVGTFGGISDLQLTVSNKSVYPLDLVVVEVQYIQSNKKIFKTENLYFRNIGAGSALMEEAPRSSRGVKVQYKITLINSKELGLAYTGI
jgi:hypothetical protein